ncbi:response regulator transcription factor [Streptomyces sp. NBC_00878]|uniref:response regulator transcription factor n=1 Tax=Streptomyces sp. NBC_00878 TaxID=2975854 RepID=UPI00224F4073|nr:response regulator transcription factor [Streptomyces sp. NBC_00878]MCX4906917.1 response regulator transcription factor [Streptomyces sp. NBC_00878]
MCAHILVAEDDVLQAALVRRCLESENHRVVIVTDGRAAIEAARQDPPDLLVLDVMMPRIDGLDVCRVLRAESDLPMLMLTARAAEDDLLLGLDLGADDYMTKPFSPPELMARVRTLLRRAGRTATPPDPVLRVGALAVDPERHEVTVDGLLVDCTPGEFQLLALLAAEPGRVFSRQQIISRQYGIDGSLTARAVDGHVMNLRRKIEPVPRRPVRLITVYGVGYKLVNGEAAARRQDRDGSREE